MEPPTDSSLPFSAACERNRDPILAVLSQAFAGFGEVVEIGAGTGQHAVYFARALPGLRWQPTDRGDYLPGLRARVAREGPPNCLAPLELDVATRPWPVTRADAVFTANTLHIMAWPEVVALFEGLGDLLGPGGGLAVYGPFRYAGRFTSDSNARFDAALRARDPASGIRDAEAVDRLAAGAGLALVADHAMPAHNQLRVFVHGPQ